MEEQRERKGQQKARVTGWQGRHCSWLPDVVHCAILPTTQLAREVSHFLLRAFYISHRFCPLWPPEQPNESQYNKHSVRERAYLTVVCPHILDILTSLVLQCDA